MQFRKNFRLASVGLIFIMGLSACGNRSGWEAFPVPVLVDASIQNDPQAKADFEEGIKFWEDRTQRKLFSIEGVWNGGKPYSGRSENPDQIFGNVVFIHNQWPFAQNFVGMTVVKPFSEGQRALVMLNPQTYFCHGDCLWEYGATSLRKTFAHEMGHFLGLGHVSDPNNIMYESAQPGGQLDHLVVDDSALRSVVADTQR